MFICTSPCVHTFSETNELFFEAEFPKSNGNKGIIHSWNEEKMCVHCDLFPSVLVQVQVDIQMNIRNPEKARSG